jgi:hypothetical protein
MFKYTVCFAVIVCLLDCSSASSIVKRSILKQSSSRPGDEEAISNDIKSTADKIIRDVDSSIRSTAKYAEWVIHAVQELGSNIATDLGKGITNYIIASVLRVDLFARLGGYRLELPESNSETKEKEYRIIAVTVGEMYSKLENMELIDQTITNTSEAAVREYLEHRSKPFGRPLTYYFYSKLEESMEENSELKKEYTTLKSEVKERTFAPLDAINFKKTPGEDPEKKIEELLGRKAVLSFILNRVFIQTATKHFSMVLSENEFDRYTFSRAILELADKSSLKLGKLQKMYTEATEKTAGKWNATDSFFVIANHLSSILFPALTELVEKDATVHAEITALKKKIGTATRFDLSMLKINLLPF